jgi:hypothetical protein
MGHALILNIPASLYVDLFKAVTAARQVREGVIMDVDAAFGYETLQLVAAVSQGIDAVPGDHVAPGDVDVHQVGTTPGQGVHGNICN